MPERTIEALAGSVRAVAGAPPETGVHDHGEHAVAGGGREVLGDAVAVECAGDAALRVDETEAGVRQPVGVPVHHLHGVTLVAVPEMVVHAMRFAVHRVHDVGRTPSERRGVIECVCAPHHVVREGEPERLVAVRVRAQPDFLHGRGGVLRHAAETEVLTHQQHVLDIGFLVGGALVVQRLENPVGHFGFALGRRAADGNLRQQVDVVVRLAVDAVPVAVEVAVERLEIEIARDGVDVAAFVGLAPEVAERHHAGVARHQDELDVPDVVSVADEGPYLAGVVLAGVRLQNVLHRDDRRGDAPGLLQVD